jgi:hypothetical protein
MQKMISKGNTEKRQMLDLFDKGFKDFRIKKLQEAFMVILERNEKKRVGANKLKVTSKTF